MITLPCKCFREEYVEKQCIQGAREHTSCQEMASKSGVPISTPHFGRHIVADFIPRLFSIYRDIDRFECDSLAMICRTSG